MYTVRVHNVERRRIRTEIYQQQRITGKLFFYYYYNWHACNYVPPVFVHRPLIFIL